MNSSTEGLDIYFDDLKRLPVLGGEEQQDLAEKVSQGDGAARDKLISHNARFVVSVAKKYRWSEVPLADLIQAGNMGLIIAVDKFDLSRGYKFITFAVSWIRQQILLCIAQQRSTIRIPIGARSLLNKIEEYRNCFLEEFGRLPSDEEIAKAVNTSVEYARQLQFSRPASSLDDTLGLEGAVQRYELVPDDTTPNPEEQYLWREEREELLKRRQLVLDILKSIPVRKVNQEMHERNIQMFIEHYGLDGSGLYPTLQEIADVHGITREAVRQSINRVFQRVQARIGLAEGKRIPAGNKSRSVWRGSAGTGLLG